MGAGIPLTALQTMRWPDRITMVSDGAFIRGGDERTGYGGIVSRIESKVRKVGPRTVPSLTGDTDLLTAVAFIATEYLGGELDLIVSQFGEIQATLASAADGSCRHLSPAIGNGPTPR